MDLSVRLSCWVGHDLFHDLSLLYYPGVDRTARHQEEEGVSAFNQTTPFAQIREWSPYSRVCSCITTSPCRVTTFIYSYVFRHLELFCGSYVQGAFAIEAVYISFSPRSAGVCVLWFRIIGIMVPLSSSTFSRFGRIALTKVSHKYVPRIDVVAG